MRKQIAFVMLAVVMSSLTVGATMSIESAGSSLELAIADPDTKCIATESRDGFVKKIKCEAGPYFVEATAKRGCGKSFGPTYCGTSHTDKHFVVANELRCPDGDSFVLHFAYGDVRCKQGSNDKRCWSEDGNDYARATCATGCSQTKGAGGCCMVGTEGCPPRPQPTGEK